MDEERRSYYAEETTIEFGEWNKFSSQQKSFSVYETIGLFRKS